MVPAFAWLVFPLVPALVGTAAHEVLNISFFDRHGGPDPYDWDWAKWLLLAGPLLGYGFLAGATLGLPDDPTRRGVKGWLARRSLWVGVGPWIGFLSVAAVFYAGSLVASGVNRAFPRGLGWSGVSFPQWLSEWLGWLAQWSLGAWLAYGWLVVARAALRRAGRLGRYRRAIGRGLIAALGFVGSLFGSFWAITASWRSYFFDARIVPLLVAASGLLVISGCGGTITYGEVRRRELFGAMLMAWLLGLALAWRWWSRPRSKPSEQRAELVDGQAGVADDPAHRERFDRFVPGHSDLAGAVAHDDVLAPPDDPKPGLLQGTDRVSMIDPGEAGHR